MIYLDWAATAPPDEEALRLAQEASLQLFGNPSSIHRAGAAARARLEECRRHLAFLLGCPTESLIFTSGGTESNNLVLASALKWVKKPPAGRKVPEMVISGIEHASIYQPVRELGQRGFDIRIIPPGGEGCIDPSRVADALTERTKLVAVMTVNNETGAVQPIDDIATAVRDCGKRTGRRIVFHTDAVQGLGKLPLAISGVDTASFSAHKIGGPKGAGALVVAGEGLLDPLYRGGGQERGLRAGTENLYGAVGFSLAAEKCLAGLPSNLEEARRRMGRLITDLRRLNAVIIPDNRADPGRFSPYILKAAFPPIAGEVLTRVLSERQICVSTGSACSSRQKDQHRILSEMGIPATVAASSIRISQGPGTNDEDLARFIDVLKKELPGLMRLAGRGG